jgi:hypothetical protein
MTPSPVKTADRAAVVPNATPPHGSPDHDHAQLLVPIAAAMSIEYQIGEQHRHLPYSADWLSRTGTAFVAELGVRRQFSAARPAGYRPPSAHRDRPHCSPRQYRVTAGQRCPSYRRGISDTKF